MPRSNNRAAMPSASWSRPAEDGLQRLPSEEGWGDIFELYSPSQPQNVDSGQVSSQRMARERVHDMEKDEGRRFREARDTAADTHSAEGQQPSSTSRSSAPTSQPQSVQRQPSFSQQPHRRRNSSTRSRASPSSASSLSLPTTAPPLTYGHTYSATLGYIKPSPTVSPHITRSNSGPSFHTHTVLSRRHKPSSSRSSLSFHTLGQINPFNRSFENPLHVAFPSFDHDLPRYPGRSPRRTYSISSSIQYRVTDGPLWTSDTLTHHGLLGEELQKAYSISDSPDSPSFYRKELGDIQQKPSYIKQSQLLVPHQPSTQQRGAWRRNMDEKSSIALPDSPVSFCPDSPNQTHDAPLHPNMSEETGHKVKKDWRFWVIFIAMLLIAFCAALDMTMISTALPAIVADLPVSSIAANWVTSAFLLPMVASQPIFGGLSCSIGRKASINSALVIFLVGSVVCACAKTFLVLVIGRGIQGLGGGGIHSMCEIIMSDLTTLRERGVFFGLIALVFAVAGFAAPVLGGAFSEHSWPWIFWINLPIGAVALVLLVLFLNIKVPLLTGKEKWQRLDLVGNAILFGSVTSILIAVTEGGIKYRWSDWRVWVPLVVGLIGFVLFLIIEWVPNRLAPKPVFPLDLFKNRTAAIAYLQTFIHGIIFYGIIYMVPIYFQAIKDRMPLQSALWSFPLTAPSFPLAMASGIAISMTGKYKLLIFLGWALMAGGVGWMTHWGVHTDKFQWAFSQVIAGAGLGIMFPITLPPIQAALPASRLESATSAYAFTRTFGAVWGITGATTIFSTQAAKNLRPYYPQLNPLGLNDFTVVAYSEYLRKLPEPLQGVVKKVYADSISYAYWLFVPLAIIGFFTTFGMKELPLPDFIKSEAKLEQKEDAVPALAGAAAAEVPSTMP